MNFSKLNSIWEEVQLSLKNKLQDNNIFNTFFQDSKLYDIKDGVAYISVKTKFAKELLESRYLTIIEMTLEEVSKNTFNCVISIENQQEEVSTIKETIKNDPNYFVAYNNGLSTVASNIEIDML